MCIEASGRTWHVESTALTLSVSHPGNIRLIKVSIADEPRLPTHSQCLRGERDDKGAVGDPWHNKEASP